MIRDILMATPLVALLWGFFAVIGRDLGRRFLNETIGELED